MTRDRRRPDPRRNSWLEDPDELRRRADFLVVDPEPVRRQAVEDAAHLRSGMVLTWLFGIAVVVIAVLLIVHLPAPRGPAEPSHSPGAGTATSARPPLGAPSGPAAAGTPAADPATTPDPGQQAAGGAPPTAPRYRGLATWYCLSGSSACTRGTDDEDLVAAIDTDLGFRRGDRVVVRYRDRSVTVRIVDVCGCPGDRLIDLTSGAFRRLADLGVGVIPVTIELASGAGSTLPPTEPEP